jgi:hypothetical protein
VVEHGDPVGDPHDHAHVVLDEQDGQAQLGHQAHQELHEAGRLALGHPGGGLVEQQERRLRGQGPSDLEPALVAVGQVAGGLVGAGAQADAVEQLRGPGPQRGLLVAEAWPPAQDVPEPQLDAGVHADQDILDGRHVGEEADVLEGPAHAQRGDLIGPQADQRAPPKGDGALVGRVEAGEDVEERRLAGAVGADDGGDAGAEREVHPVQRGEAAEALGHPPGLEQGRHPSSRWRRRAGRMPWGRKIIMATRIRPKIMRSYLAGSNWVGSWARL